jgi:type II secretory pathway component GspD/PulD (secretin)
MAAALMGTQGIAEESTRTPQAGGGTQAREAASETSDVETSLESTDVKIAGGVATEASEPTLRFSFDRTPWRDVISWIADEADLALHVSDLPTGSFSYSDPNEFSYQEAIDRLNLFLLPEGFALVRNGNLLSVINLADPRSKQQLDALADLIQAEDLPNRSSHDVVKCIFPLGEISAEEAVQELTVLKLMNPPDVLSKTNQIMVTDSVAKLRSVQKVLEAFRSDQLDNGTVVKSFALEHVDAEDVLVVARPHLGLATDEMIGIDVSVSADLKGKNLFVTGVEDKVKLLEGLVLAIDRPTSALSTKQGEAELRNYRVSGGNVDTVYNVLQTLLAGKDVRLSIDEASSSVVALASADVQREIEQTVMQLQANEADFEVIPLKTADPYLVISLLEEMLDLPGPLDDPDDIDPDAPKIDADPANRRLFVRAKAPQIEQIKKIVSGLDQSSAVEDSSQLRLFPLRGAKAEIVLESAAKFWRGENPVVLYRSRSEADPESTERVLTEEKPSPRPSSNPVVDTKYQRWLTTNVHSSSPAIRCQLTPQGLLMQSDDLGALDAFENHLRTIAMPFESMPSPPIVFYLKYTKAVDAVRMLAELLEGGEAAGEATSSTLVNGYVSSADSFFGSYVSSEEGTMTLTSGTLTVLADSRLNRLIAQGSTEEIEQIEGYLRIIDKDNSITSVETYGTSHVIELVNTKASEVAEAVREAFAGRVIEEASKQTAQAGSGSERPQPQSRVQQDERDRRSDDRPSEAKGGSQPVQDLEPKMTVAVHEPSNSLIITAPQQLFKEAEKLVRSIDQRAEETVQVFTPVNGEVFESVLQQFLGQSPTSRRSSSYRSSPSRSDRSSDSRVRSDR